MQELESFRGHDHERSKRSSAGSLAIPAVTVKHHAGPCRGFVANRAASASARKGCRYRGHIFFALMIFVRSIVRRMSERSQDNRFSTPIVLVLRPRAELRENAPTRGRRTSTRTIKGALFTGRAHGANGRRSRARCIAGGHLLGRVVAMKCRSAMVEITKPPR